MFSKFEDNNASQKTLAADLSKFSEQHHLLSDALDCFHWQFLGFVRQLSELFIWVLFCIQSFSDHYPGCIALYLTVN